MATFKDKNVKKGEIKVFSFFIVMLFFGSLTFFGQNTWTVQTYNPNVAGIEYNPMKGLIPGYSGINSTFPYGADHFYIDLKSTYIGYDNYNWSAFEAKLNDAVSRGVQTSTRFWIDYPNKDYGMPTFLQSLVPAEDYTAQGNTIGKSKLPDWNNETLISALEQFIAAFGARYDGDPRLFMIEAGLYGFWGEWHVSGTTGKEMNQVNKDRIINAYLKAFTKTHISLRQANHPGTVDLANKLGYYDDSFCYQTICTNGTWCFLYSINGRGLQDNYKYHPRGGEVFPATQATMFDAWPNALIDGTGKKIAEDITTSVNESHMSVNKCFTVFKQQPTTTQFNNALKMHKMMGYQFYVSEVQLVGVDTNQFTANVKIQNKGVAPFYYNWEFEFAAINNMGQIITIGKTDWNINTVMPDGIDNLKSFTGLLPSTGTYKILMRVINPLESLSIKAKVLRFANEKQDADKSGWLTIGTVTSGGPLSADKFEKDAKNSINMYPNPTSGVLNIDFPDGKTNREIKVFNAVGQLVYSIRTSSSKAQIDIHSLHLKGLVLVQLISGELVSNHKVIVN